MPEIVDRGGTRRAQTTGAHQRLMCPLCRRRNFDGKYLAALLIPIPVVPFGHPMDQVEAETRSRLCHRRFSDRIRASGAAF